MTLTQEQKFRFADMKEVGNALTIADLEASNETLIRDWNEEWIDYCFDTSISRSDRPPGKPQHP